MAEELDDLPPPPPPGGGADDAETWYRTEIQAHPEKYDTGISKDVWLSWFPLWNGRTKKFKSIKVDGSGKAFDTEEDKPTDCPMGLIAYGQSQCLPLDHPKVRGVKPGAPGAAAAAAPDAPVTEGAPGAISYTGNPIVDALLYQFNNRRSLDTGAPGLFGWAGGRNPGEVGKDAPDITGRLLQGGGLLWSEDGTPAPAAAPAAVAPAPVATTPAAATPTPDVSGGSVTPPVVAPLFTDPETPLQKMLKGKRKQGAFGGSFNDLFPAMPQM